MIKIKKGLDLPITGAPEQVIKDTKSVKRVAVLGEDYVGMKPTMLVEEGDKVALGQPLFTDKKNPGVQFTAPAAGTVSAINRGHRRKLVSVVIDIEGDDAIEFKRYSAQELNNLQRQDVVDNLVNSGLWTALRVRPFSKVPAIDATTKALFITAIDTHPLSPDPSVIIKANNEAFNQGIEVLSHLSEGKVFVCTGDKADFTVKTGGKVEQHVFSGVHPAGLPGTHIHFLHGATVANPAWYIGYQDVIAVGKLFTEGKLFTDRVIAIGGPKATHPRLVNTRMGADLNELLQGEVAAGDVRRISGSVFGGFSAAGQRAFLGRYHNQVSLLAEGREKEFFGWIMPGSDKFSVTRTFVSHLMPSKKFDFTTTTGGSERAIMPIGTYEQVMPLDILATQLLRALVTRDTDTAQQLGCLELDEEDLALLTFVCPGKYEYGPILRDVLTTIEKEG
jgi:Na+-transporting NADH:ubiquinone oxidoreductase subunit A